ncbi:ATP-binding cassette domain-containing protein [Lacticaseibacillus pabuli]|uniref:ATP-binding cassette domain-containing protein n=1 Tax=Lacticaseibacillus pabuli TaxID=3025672 RepID=A0ABY7WVK2_9LACO|nr:ATP-binding cassette domain-containing protein [Lacticaseibacillus sp. KACC 23028]WDF83031.1 ATP-binding cassette domain-containing protein [Lacticaseibacillus sp. KACC 23028]
MTDNILEIHGLNQYFEQGTPNENHALKDINLTLKRGEFVAIIGGNGAGKSTLLNSVAGSLPVSMGQIKIGGEDVTYQSVEKRARLISRVFQDPRQGSAPLLTVEENLSLALKRGNWRNFWSHGVKRSERPTFRKKLASLGLGLENRLTAEIGLLSGGQRQAITLLMATMKQPELLLLDEHTAALDPATSATVMQITDKLVQDEQLTALMITHNMQDALKYGNRLLMLDHGQIAIDLNAEQKKGLTVADLLAMFKEKSGTELNDDAVLLSE